jgi:hypothetical protein
LDGVLGVQMDDGFCDQVGLVSGGGQLPVAPAAGGEAEVRVALDAQAVSGAVGQLRPAHVCAVAVLLRAYVRGLQLVDGGGVSADAGGVARVGVCLAGSGAEPRDPGDLLGQQPT